MMTLPKLVFICFFFASSLAAEPETLSTNIDHGVVESYLIGTGIYDM
jgi:hypothetical protein